MKAAPDKPFSCRSLFNFSLSFLALLSSSSCYWHNVRCDWKCCLPLLCIPCVNSLLALAGCLLSVVKDSSHVRWVHRQSLCTSAGRQATRPSNHFIRMTGQGLFVFYSRASATDEGWWKAFKIFHCYCDVKRMAGNVTKMLLGKKKSPALPLNEHFLFKRYKKLIPTPWRQRTSSWKVEVSIQFWQWNRSDPEGQATTAIWHGEWESEAKWHDPFIL